MRVARTVVLTLLLASAARAGDPLPTQVEIQRLANQRDWPAVLGAVSRILPAKLPAAAGYDRADLWMKKAEAQVQSLQFSAAAQSFDRAAVEPGVSPNVADLAIASAALVRHSDRNGYRPAVKPLLANTPSYDIFDPASRVDALGAYFRFEVDAIKLRTDKANNSVDAPTIVALLKAVSVLRPLDRVVNRNGEQTDDIEKSIATNFAAVADTWTQRTGQRLTAIKTSADEYITVKTFDCYGQHLWARKRGTSTGEKKEVGDAIDQSRRIAATYVTLMAAVSTPLRDVLEPVKQPLQAAYDQATFLLQDIHYSKSPFANSPLR